MKKVKNVAIVVTLAGIFISICMVFSWQKEVKAGNLIQSDDEISKEVKHSHVEDICNESIWVPCGGTWSAYFEPYHMCTCYSCSNWNSDELSNGVPLNKIHGAFVTNHEEGIHDGAYYSKTCEYDQVGDFIITKEKNGDHVTLQAHFDNRADIVGEYSISWNGCQTNQSGDNYEVVVSHNGIYTASLNWYDTKTDEWCQESLSYTDTSIPITMNFYDGDQLIGSRQVSYGGELPEPPASSKEGYNFTSYTYNDQNIYTQEYNPVNSISTRWETESVDIYAKYSPKQYLIYYGKDANQDGIPDKQVRVTYGEAYEALDLEEGEIGSITGFGVDGINFYDYEGNPNYESWMWDIEDGTALITKYKKSESHEDEKRDDNNDTEKLNVDISKTQKAETKEQELEMVQESNLETTIPILSESNEESNAEPTIIEKSEDKEENKKKNKDNINKLKEDLIEGEPEKVVTYIPDKTPYPKANQSEAKLSSNNSSAKEDLVAPEVVKSKKSKSSTIELIEQAVVISCAVVGGAMALYGLVWYWFYLYSSVGLYSFNRDGKRKFLGRIIVYKKGNIFICKIKDQIIDKSQLDVYEVEFIPDFLKRNRNKDIILCIGNIKKGGIRISEVIMPELRFDLMDVII